MKAQTLKTLKTYSRSLSILAPKKKPYIIQDGRPRNRKTKAFHRFASEEATIPCRRHSYHCSSCSDAVGTQGVQEETSRRHMYPSVLSSRGSSRIPGDGRRRIELLLLNKKHKVNGALKH